MSTDLTPETLAELRRLADAATPRPWSTVSGAGNVWHFREEGTPTVVAGHQCAAPRVPDAELIAAAVNLLPALLDAAAERDALADRIERVRALHFGEYVEDEDRNRCFECGDDWPCPTARALDGEADR